MKEITDKTNIVTDRQKAVLETMRMRLTEKEALELLDRAFVISLVILAAFVFVT